MVLCTVAFIAFALPAGNSIGTWLLTSFFGAEPSLVSIRSLDEAVVIGAALSLSSSAFVLSILNEKGELSTRFGAATLGILLFQVRVVGVCCFFLFVVFPYLLLSPCVHGPHPHPSTHPPTHTYIYRER